METTGAVPLFRCSDCGFVTTASPMNALRAHQAGAPTCSGELQLVADFRKAPMLPPRPRHRRRATGQLGVEAPPMPQAPIAPQAPAMPPASVVPQAPVVAQPPHA